MTRPSTRALALTAATAIAVAGFTLILVANSGSWIYLDEWDWGFLRSDMSADSIFNPQNQNWYSTTVLVYQVLHELFGLTAYVPFRVVGAALVAAVGLCGYAYARRRIGPWWALLPLALLVVSPGGEILLWPFQIGQLLAGLGGVGALLALDRAPTRWNRAAAALLLLLAVASSSAGVPFVAIVIVDRLLRRGRRLDALVVLPAILAYGAWYAEYGSREPRASELNADTLNAVVNKAYDVGAGAVQAMLGLAGAGSKGALIGQVGLVALLVVACWRVFGPYRQARGRVVALAVGLVAYWLLLAWGRPYVDLPLSPRYLFLSHLLLVLLAVELARPLWASAQRDRGSPRRWSSPRTLAAGAGVALLLVGGWSVAKNAQRLIDYGDFFERQGELMRGQMYAMGVLDGGYRTNGTFLIEPSANMIPRAIAPYFATADRFDTTIPGEREVLSLSATARRRADQALWSVYNLANRPVAPIAARGTAPRIAVVSPGAAVVRRAGPCTSFRATRKAPATVELMPSGGVLNVTNRSRTPLAIRALRWGPGWVEDPRPEPGYRIAGEDVPPGATRTVLLPPDRGRAPWRLRLTGTAGRVCTARNLS